MRRFMARNRRSRIHPQIKHLHTVSRSGCSPTERFRCVRVMSYQDTLWSGADAAIFCKSFITGESIYFRECAAVVDRCIIQSKGDGYIRPRHGAKHAKDDILDCTWSEPRRRRTILCFSAGVVFRPAQQIQRHFIGREGSHQAVDGSVDYLLNPQVTASLHARFEWGSMDSTRASSSRIPITTARRWSRAVGRSDDSGQRRLPLENILGPVEFGRPEEAGDIDTPYESQALRGTTTQLLSLP